MRHIAFQGGSGANGHETPPWYGGEQITAVPCATCAEVFDAVARRAADAAMVPVGNLYAGPVQEVCTLLNDTNMVAAGTCQRLVSHCVMALPGSALEHITQVHPHPQASLPCDACPERLHVEIIGALGTAGGAKCIREQEPLGGAAIASPRAVRLYQPAPLAEDIQARTDHSISFVPLCASALGHKACALLCQLEAARVSGHYDQAEALLQCGQQRCRREDWGIRDVSSLAAGGPASTDRHQRFGSHRGGFAARGPLTTWPRSGCNPVPRSQEVRV